MTMLKTAVMIAVMLTYVPLVRALSMHDSAPFNGRLDWTPVKANDFNHSMNHRGLQTVRATATRSALPTPTPTRPALDGAVK